MSKTVHSATVCVLMCGGQTSSLRFTVALKSISTTGGISFGRRFIADREGEVGRKIIGTVRDCCLFDANNR